MFCNFCGNLLHTVQHSTDQILSVCEACPIIFQAKKTVSNRTYCQAKTVDDVLGGPDAWKYCDVTAEQCPKCNHSNAYFVQMQTRSADEPMTNFYRCCNQKCAYNWRD